MEERLKVLIRLPEISRIVHLGPWSVLEVGVFCPQPVPHQFLVSAKLHREVFPEADHSEFVWVGDMRTQPKYPSSTLKGVGDELFVGADSVFKVVGE
jgi:hypothetical protein